MCAHPECERASVHAHHIWSRAMLRGEPYEWIQLPDGTTIGNRTGLCLAHHDDVTSPVGGHRARIAFSSGVFWWEIRREIREVPLIPSSETSTLLWKHVGALDPQPPGAAGHVAKPVVDEACPTCGHRKRTNGAKPSSPRKTKQWTLTVPDDAEHGAEILDEWADDLATAMGFGDQTSRLRRYHAVVTALAWVSQNRNEFLLDLVGPR